MSDTGEAFWRWLGRGLLAVVVLVAALTASDYGSSWDEKVRADAGERKLEYYAHLFSGDWEKAVEVGRKADNYPGFYDLNLAILRRVSPFSDTLTGHVFSAFFGVLGIAGAMRLGRSLGGAQVGFWTGTLLAFTPSYYGHMFINPKDIPFACAYIWMLWAALEWLKEGNGLRWRTAFVFGATLGVALAVRIGGALGLCYLGLFLAIKGGLGVRREGLGYLVGYVKVHGARLGAALALAAVILLLYWPAAQFRPFGQASSTLEKVTQYSWDLPVFFEGAFYAASDLPFYYIIKMLLLKLPLVFLTFLGIGLAAVAGKLRADLRSNEWTLERWQGLGLTLFAGLSPIAYVIGRDSTLYNGLRHLLFVVPIAASLAGWGMVQARRWLSAQRPALERPLLGFAGIALALVAFSSVRIHPYQYIYYNELSGGVASASNTYETDYWGTVYKELAQELEALVEGSERIQVNMEHPTWLLSPHVSKEASKRIRVTRSDPLADDFYIASSQWAADRYYFGEEIAHVERMGVTLGVIKDRRGLTPEQRVLGYELGNKP
ncbi:MAG: hypothetical protein CBD18_01640 [Opitutales bacterium TMED158]|nr:MAG: hypothetical protein CBD18_01640 [Opitutales bacterium TMED158]